MIGRAGIARSVPTPGMPAGPEALWRERIQSIPPADPQPAHAAWADSGTHPPTGSHIGTQTGDDHYRQAHPGAEDNATPAGPGGHPPPADPGDGSISPKRRRWRRRRRILAIGAVVQLVVLVAGDRFAVSAAEDQMAKQIEASVTESLACDVVPPTVSNVSIGGFPFLTQIMFGNFKNIGVNIEGIPTPGPRISSVEAHLKGLHIPVKKILTNSVGEVPVDNVEATVRLDYDDVNTFLADQPGKIQINPVDGGEQVEVSGTADVPVLGAQEVGGVTTFEIRDNKLILVPSELSLRGGLNFSIPVPGGVGELLPSVPIPVGGLPFDLNIVEASTDASGLSLTATAKDVTLPEAEARTRQCPPTDNSGN